MAEQCINVFLTNKNTTLEKFTAGAISGLLHQVGESIPGKGAGTLGSIPDDTIISYSSTPSQQHTALEVMKCGCLNENKHQNKGRLVERTIMLRNVAGISENHPSRGRSLQICSRVGSHRFRLSAHLSAVGAVAVLKLNISLQQNKESKEMRGNWFHLHQLTLSGCQSLAT